MSYYIDDDAFDIPSPRFCLAWEHSWESGMMVVSTEDLPGMLEGPRAKDVECVSCETRAVDLVARVGLDTVMYGD